VLNLQHELQDKNEKLE
jgi:chromosome segregation ATPase